MPLNHNRVLYSSLDVFHIDLSIYKFLQNTFCIVQISCATKLLFQFFYTLLQYESTGRHVSDI